MIVQLKSNLQKLEIVCPYIKLDCSNSLKFKAEINSQITNKPDLVIINLQNVHYMDSSGLSCLLSTLKAIREFGGELFLCSINEQVEMLFELTSVNTLFKFNYEG